MMKNNTWISVRDSMPEIPVGTTAKFWVIVESNVMEYVGNNLVKTAKVNRWVGLFDWYNLNATQDEIDHVDAFGEAPESAQWINEWMNEDGDFYDYSGFHHEYSDEGTSVIDAYELVDGIPTNGSNFRANRIVAWIPCERPEIGDFPIDIQSAEAALKGGD